MADIEIPLGVCRCRTVKHAISPASIASTRELIRTAKLHGKQDLVDCYSERLARCSTAYNRGQVAS